MGISRVPGQVRRAPTLVVRAVFAGIGRILLSADRPLPSADAVAAGNSEQPGQAAAGSAGNGEQPGHAAARRQRHGLAPVAPPGSRWRSLDKTGNVRLLSDENTDDDYDVLPEARRSGAVRKSGAASVPHRPASTPRPAPAKQTLPLANYDALSLASIRARLRGLDVSQLRILAEYESKNAERPEVLGMFERRIEKLEAGELQRTPVPA
ncbi:MAG TPA: hypothetical protein VKB62_08250 [Streptosporangiaceae bacterium]|nr:hypothetical protein [Streptosporangiaceae bacterium]